MKQCTHIARTVSPLASICYRQYSAEIVVFEVYFVSSVYEIEFSGHDPPPKKKKLYPLKASCLLSFVLALSNQLALSWHCPISLPCHGIVQSACLVMALSNQLALSWHCPISLPCHGIAQSACLVMTLSNQLALS